MTMEHLTNKRKIISVLSESLESCPCQLDCVALFGSIVKADNYRDIDILVIVHNQNDIDISEQWFHKYPGMALNRRLDIKCYDFQSFLNMIRERTPLTLSLGAEMEFLLRNSAIEQELVYLKQYLSDTGIELKDNRTWKVAQKVFDNILDKENQRLRGFLVSHLDWIEDRKEAKKLLHKLSPIEEPYTRIACFKRVIKLVSSEEYRHQFDISLQESLELALQIVSNRAKWDWSTFEDYDHKDLCIELVNALENLPSEIWNSAEALLDRLIRDYNHFVRKNTILLIHNRILAVNSALGFRLLATAFKSEHKFWMFGQIFNNLFIINGDINTNHLKVLLNGYTSIESDPKILTYIQTLQKSLGEHSLNNDVSNLIAISHKVMDLDTLLKRGQAEGTYLSRALNHIKTEVDETISATVIQKQGINIKNLQLLFEQSRKAIPSESLKKLFDLLSRLNITAPFKPEYYTYAIQLHSVIREISGEGLLNFVLRNMANSLAHVIRDFGLSPFFLVTPRPRFGLKINKKQPLKFIVRNLSETEIPNVSLDIQSSAEMEVTENWPYKMTYKPEEQKEINCQVTPHVAKQIAISYKVNGRFGEPIYISAERENPFIPNQPAHLAHFVGREDELQVIREEIYQQHFLIFGPRRIGKTSLLYQLREELGGSYIPVYLSLQKLNTRDGDSLFCELKSEVTRELTGRNLLMAHDSTTDWIRGIESHIQDRKLAILIDEMDVGQRVENFSLFLEKIRAVTQHTPFIRIVFSSGPFITQALVNPMSPLFNMVKHISLRRFAPEDAEKLLRLAEDQDIVFEENTIGECLEWTGNLPLYLQIMGDRLYQILKNKGTREKKVSQQIVDQVRQAMVSDILEWERLWNILSDLEKAVLAFCAHREERISVPDLKNNIEHLSGQKFSFAHIRESLKNLVWYGLLDNNDAGCNLTAALVREWLITHLYYPEEIQDLFCFACDNVK